MLLLTGEALEREFGPSEVSVLVSTIRIGCKHSRTPFSLGNR